MFFFSPETKLGSEIMRKILNFASFEVFPLVSLRSEITKSKRSEKFKAKKSEKKRKKAKTSEKKRKKAKK